MKRLKIEKSLYPDGEKTHLVNLISETKRGCNSRRIFKGTYKECRKFKKELEE